MVIPNEAFKQAPKITLNHAIEHAAKHDELDIALIALFDAFNKKQVIEQKEALIKDDMAAYAALSARCDNAIKEIDNILNESAKYLRSNKLCLVS